jgi:ABC-type bacteriocin/lantibiotic exporter with double-glycine peptidase domain
MFAPVITLVLYASIARARGDSALPAETAFTSIALLAMVTHPANMVMTIVPRAIASLSNSERILKYMMQDTNEDHRLDIGKASLNISNYPESDREPAIILADTTIQYPHSSKPTLEQINCKIYKGSIVMCSGPVGAGKTTLARAILGEVTTSGSAIFTSSKRIGVCSQEPWLPSGSIKDVICGGAKLDGRWYQTVLLACDLTNDLESLLKGDTTEIKFPGFNLSEGQRQRVVCVIMSHFVWLLGTYYCKALARVLYARCDIVILDDTFRALDGRTEKTIVDNLLGPGGIFRKQGTTVLVITNSGEL